MHSVRKLYEIVESVWADWSCFFSLTLHTELVMRCSANCGPATRLRERSLGRFLIRRSFSFLRAVMAFFPCKTFDDASVSLWSFGLRVWCCRFGDGPAILLSLQGNLKTARRGFGFWIPFDGLNVITAWPTFSESRVFARVAASCQPGPGSLWQRSLITSTVFIFFWSPFGVILLEGNLFCTRKFIWSSPDWVHNIKHIGLHKCR